MAFIQENLTAEDIELEKEKEKVISGLLESQMSDEEKKKSMSTLSHEQIEFVIEKLGDKFWRIENLYFIVNEDGEKVRFKPNFIQREIIAAIFLGDDDYIRHIILKYRQGGVSTLFTILLLDEFLWGGTNVYNVIIAHERKLLVSLFKKIRFAYDCLEPEFKIFIPKMDSDNANELFISSTNNRLAVSLDTRGETPTRLHITELAWREVPQQAKLLLAVNPLRKCKITIESTANGVGDPFYNLVQSAREGKGTYKLLFYPWFIDERNQEKIPTKEEFVINGKEKQLRTLYDLTPMQLYWRRKQIADAMALGEDGEKKFQQENPANIDEAFVSSGTQVFDLSLEYNIEKPLQVIGDFEIYGDPEDAMVFGVDTAEGGGKSDYSVICGMSRTGKVLVMYRKKVQDFQLAASMDELLSLKINGKYFVGTILIERNKGAAFVTEARHYSWFNLILKGRDQVATTDDTKEYYGFYTSKTSKELLIRDFRKGIYNKSLTITTKIYEELCTYVYHTGGSAGAMTGKHDDTVMACMIAYHGILYEHFVVTYAIDNTERKFKNPLEEFDAKIMSGDFIENEYSEWENSYS